MYVVTLSEHVSFYNKQPNNKSIYVGTRLLRLCEIILDIVKEGTNLLSTGRSRAYTQTNISKRIGEVFVPSVPKRNCWSYHCLKLLQELEYVKFNPHDYTWEGQGTPTMTPSEQYEYAQQFFYNLYTDTIRLLSQEQLYGNKLYEKLAINCGKSTDCRNFHCINFIEGMVKIRVLQKYKVGRHLHFRVINPGVVLPYVPYSLISDSRSSNEIKFTRDLKQYGYKYYVEVKLQKLQERDPLLPKIAVPNCLKKKKWDFFIQHESGFYLVELDGQQHFKHITHFNKTATAYQKRQQVDRNKTFMPVKLGFKVVRIHHRDIAYGIGHLRAAIESEQFVYYSSPLDYAYLSGEV